MTFTLLAVNPNRAAWLVTDQNISVGPKVVDHDWCKQVAIYAADGSMLLSYNGLARTPDYKSIADWICDTICEGRRIPPGSRIDLPSVHCRGIQEYLDLIADRATSVFSQGPPAYRQSLLTIAGVAFLKTGVARVAVGNRLRRGGTRSSFAVVQNILPDATASVFTDGSGAEFLPSRVLEQVAEMTYGADQDLRDYMLPLHEVNKIVAARSANIISPWSQVTCMPLSGLPLETRSFMDPGLRSSRTFRPIRIAYAGWDFTPALMNGIDELRRDHPERNWISDEWTFGLGVQSNVRGG